MAIIGRLWPILFIFVVVLLIIPYERFVKSEKIIVRIRITAMVTLLAIGVYYLATRL